jgi:hypothetical protein
MLPPLYAAWIEPVLGVTAPDEPEATCDRCAMQVMPGEPTRPGDVCFTEAKCCTYHPRLDNFLAGRILGDASEEARPAVRWLEQAIASGPGVTPLLVDAPPTYWLMYDNATAAFGRSRTLRCPVFDASSGRCGIWRHRNSVCATWFCKHARGAAGTRFWDAAHQLLEQLERSVAIHCAASLELGDAALALALNGGGRRSGVTGRDLDGAADPAAHRRTWGRWHTREREFFGRCRAIAEALSPAEVLALGGAQAVALGRMARSRLDELRAPELPPGPFRLGTFEVVRSDRAAARVCTYSSYDPLDVPSRLLAALLRFDGRPTEQVVREIAERDGLAIPDALLRTLVDFELLVRADD